MDVPRLIIALLTLAAFVLPLLGIALAYRHAREVLDGMGNVAARFNALEADWRTETRELDDRLKGEPTQEREDARREVNLRHIARFEAEGLPVPTVSRVSTVPFEVTAIALRLAFAGNRWNAAIAILGLACGFVAAIWSLYLPAA